MRTFGDRSLERHRQHASGWPVEAVARLFAFLDVSTFTLFLAILLSSFRTKIEQVLSSRGQQHLREIRKVQMFLYSALEFLPLSVYARSFTLTLLLLFVGVH